MYKAFVLHSNSTSTAFKRWSDSTSQPLEIVSKEEWNEANLSVYRATRETKLQSLHFKIINRVVPCNKFLRQIRIKTSDACELCGQEDSLLHFFLDCQTVKDCWASLCGWFNRVEDLALETLSQKQFMFGVPRSFNKERVVNFILMNTKYFIYRQRLFHGGKLKTLQWLREFKGKLLMEKHINLIEGKSRFFRKWNAILEALGWGLGKERPGLTSPTSIGGDGLGVLVVILHTSACLFQKSLLDTSYPPEWHRAIPCTCLLSIKTCMPFHGRPGDGWGTKQYTVPHFIHSFILNLSTSFTPFLLCPEPMSQDSLPPELFPTFTMYYNLSLHLLFTFIYPMINPPLLPVSPSLHLIGHTLLWGALYMNYEFYLLIMYMTTCVIFTNVPFDYTFCQGVAHPLHTRYLGTCPVCWTLP